MNVFAGEPPPGDLSWWDRMGGAADRLSRFDERLAEDREALASVGRRPKNLGFVDFQYREGEQELEPVVDAIALAAPEGRLLAPAAVAGDHPDHALVRAAALALRERGREVALYADLPHASRNGVPAWVASGDAEATGGGRDLSLNGAGIPWEAVRPAIRRLEPAEEAQKRGLCDRYGTQIGAVDEMFELAKHPERLRYEVIWPLPSGG